LRFHSDWRIFVDFAQTLLRTTLKLYASDMIGIKDVRDLCTLDSTTIDCCLALFLFFVNERETANLPVSF